MTRRSVVISAFGVYTIVAQFIDVSAPRYLKAVGCVLGGVLIATASLPGHYRPAIAKAVGAFAVLLLAIAGVVSSRSIDEAFSLITGAILLGLVSWATWNPSSRFPRHRSA